MKGIEDEDDYEFTDALAAIRSLARRNAAFGLVCMK